MKENIRKILRLICILICVFCVGWLIYYAVSTKNSEKQAEELKNQFVTTDTESETENSTAQTDAGELPIVEAPAEESLADTKPFGDVEYSDLSAYDVPELKIDFAGLQETNSDIYAWITVPGTKIDYPVLQSDTDPDYYLTKDVNKQEAVAGSIFTQFYNRKGFVDHNTVIYGHNMKNGSMFASLHYYEDGEFFAEHPYVYLFTPEYTLVYQIFGAFEFSNAHLLFAYDFDNEESFQLYLDGIFGIDGLGLGGLKDHFNTDPEVSGKDRIITLSTCIKNKPDKRYLVQAKLIAVGEGEPNGRLAED